MGLEIERKFLVKNNTYLKYALSEIKIKQGYISRNIDSTVRVRIKDNSAFLTIKTKNHGSLRHEYEYAIPTTDALELISICNGLIIDKTRYIVPFEGFIWEIDVFHGKLEGIVVAEIELSDTSQSFPLPPFIGEEVTGKPEYYNSNMHLLLTT